MLPKLEAAQWMSREELEAVRWRRLSRLLKHAYDNVPYYRKVFENARLSPEEVTDYRVFRSLPFLSKSDVRESRDLLVAANMDRTAMRRDSTGGSTGENISFLEDKTELSYRFANMIRGDTVAGLRPGTRFIELWGAAFDAPDLGLVGDTLTRVAFRKLFLSAYNLSEKQMSVYVRRIEKFRPEVILAYPSPLYHFGRFLAARELEIPSVRSIITSAETLQDYQRDCIEAVFSCKIFNRYGCREFGAIGVECEAHQGIHVFSDMFFVEILRDGVPVKEGEEGEIVITDLHKYGMPFIRYRIGDLAVPSLRTCSCGRPFPMLEEVRGRVFDIVVAPDGRYVSGTFWTLLVRTVEGIKNFQVVQEASDRVEVSIVVDDRFEPDSIGLLEARIKEKCGDTMNVGFKIVNNIPPTKSGKHRFVISKVPVSFN